MTQQIVTGLEYDNAVDAEADVYAFADDGEHAVVWAIDRYDDYEAHVKVFYCEAGLTEFHAGEAWTIDADKATEEFAREFLDDPTTSVDRARDHWGVGEQ